MNAWEGQVLAIAVKELLEAFKTLGRDGFGRKNRKLLSSVIQDLLTVDPNLTRAETTLEAYEALGGKPSPDLFLAKEMLAAVKKRRLLENAAGPKGIPLVRPDDRKRAFHLSTRVSGGRGRVRGASLLPRCDKKR
jgi:hypothetical protein